MSYKLITIKTLEEREKIKEGGHLLGDILKKLGKMAKPGVTTEDLEEAADKMIKECGGIPSFRHYHSYGEPPYPTILCASIDDEVVHCPALPARKLLEGQILSLDIGMVWKGLFTDTALTVPIGRISKEAKKLLDVTQKSLFVGIKAAKPGATIGDIGRAIENYIKPHHYGIVRDLVGHGVGYAVHEEPRIPNYFDRTLPRVEIKEGMVLAIEPMITLGDWRIMSSDDGWSIKTIDGSLSAHFEHTIIITSKGAEIATL